MKWTSNAKSNAELINGTIFECMDVDCKLSIHKIIGCGDNYFLSCPILNLSAYDLHTNDFECAVRYAKKAVELGLRTISNKVSVFISDDSAIELRRY